MYTEFAHDKEALFDKLCSSREIAGEFEKLRQLVLVKEFKSYVLVNIKIYTETNRKLLLFNKQRG